MIDLSKRLEFIASFVDEGMLIGDIGSDHGYLPLYLLENDKVDYIYACDNKKGPYHNLTKAFLNIDKKKYDIALEDGINHLPSRVNTVILTGMGGDLIVNILKNNDYLTNVEYLILSPQHNIKGVRKFVTENGYKIIDEGIVYDEKYYEIIKCQKGEQKLNKAQKYFGPINLKRKDKVFINMYQTKILELKKLLSIETISSLRRKEIEDEINFILEEVIQNGQ